jgi:hypothetical protein
LPSLVALFAPLKLVKHFLVQPERLLPHFKFVPRQLGLLFIRSKIKTKIDMRHAASLQPQLFLVKKPHFLEPHFLDWSAASRLPLCDLTHGGKSHIERKIVVS